MLNGIFASIYGETVSVAALLISSAVSLFLGAVIAFVHRRTTGAGDSMGGALTFLPFLVHIVILLVNGNIGAGVAVAGAFSLVRFRSAPGSAKDITIIFLAMTVGLACGMGYITLAALAAAVICAVSLLEYASPSHGGDRSRELRITIPENMDYTDLFTDLMKRYTSQSMLTQVKTVSMGSLYCLHYRVRLKDTAKEKQFIDELRCRNGNLEISCGRTPSGKEGKESL
ncbi:MAG: DUF4956 domain-containing protein [Bacillota bacterium]|jgi:hypothetical protein